MRRNSIRIRVMITGLALALMWHMPPAGCLYAEAGTAEETGKEETDDGEGAEKSGEDAESGEETAPEKVTIRTAEDFLDFARQCYLDAWSVNKLVVLENDIDLSETDFEMVPVFAGTFDGGGHTISGFRNVGDGYVGGLFRYITPDGTVKNLNLKGSVEGTGTKECIGGICGFNYGTIRRCSFNGTLNGRDTVGGIAGTNGSSGLILYCSIKGHVSGYYMTGGIAGVNHGFISQCSNYSGINNDSTWVEEDDEMGSDLLSGIGSSDRDIELYSGVDTGGIAGFSDGTVTDCVNYGTVGYEHAGYNIGGIAGRQSGVVSFCENKGRVYGRKDVGGIVGQMEPYIEVDEAESLRNAVNKLHDLIGGTLDHLHEGKDAVKKDLDSLTAYGDGVLSTGNMMADQLADFMDTNMNQIREINARMDYVVSLLPPMMEDLTAAGTSLGNFSDMLKQAVKDAAIPNREAAGGTAGAENTAATGEDGAKNTEELQKELERLRQSADTVSGILLDGNGSVKEWSELTSDQQELLASEIAALMEETVQAEQSAQDVLAELERVDAVTEQARRDLETAADHLRESVQFLKSAAERAKSAADYLNGQPDIHFVALGEEFNRNRETLYGQLQGISESLKNLNQNVSDYSDLTNADLKAVNDQLNVVFNLLADHLSGDPELSVEELYEEVSDEEIDSIDTGRTDSCTNQGIVKGDINIGGIAGSMAIDEEDPEDNAAGSIDYEIGRRFIMKCIIRNCENQGYVTAKKDGAGGIAGYMAHGLVIDSESYGSVESTEGDYVGGICGESLTVIRRCYALCSVSGGRNVGGIAGYANTLKDCYAMVEVEASAGRKGAVAGQIAEQEDGAEDAEPNVCRNYYVGDSVYGIDDISYVGEAEPISYQELLKTEGLPEEFRHLKVVYKVDDISLGEQEVKYGESLSCLQYPVLPEKEGYYGVWPDCSGQTMRGNLVLQGEYRDNVLVVESREKEKQDTEGAYEFPYGLVGQTFTEDTRLDVQRIQMSPPQQAAEREYVVYQVTVSDSGLEDGETLAVRLLNPYEDALIWEWKDDAWVQLESMPRGRYLQVQMAGDQGVYCVSENHSDTVVIVAGAAAAAAVVILLTLLIRGLVLRRKRKKERVREAENED